MAIFVLTIVDSIEAISLIGAFVETREVGINESGKRGARKAGLKINDAPGHQKIWS